MTLLRLAAGTLCLLYPFIDCWLRRHHPRLHRRLHHPVCAVPLLACGVVAGMDDTRTLPHLRMEEGGCFDQVGALGILSAPAAWGTYRQHLLVYGGPRKRQVRPTTITAYRKVLTDFFATLPAGRQWWQATPKHLARYLDLPIRSGPKQGQPLASSTRAHRSMVIINFYRLAARKRWGPKASTWADARPDPWPQPTVRALELADVARLLRSLVNDPVTRIAAALGYYTMLRAGEMARLRVEDVDLRTRPPVMRVDGKGGKQRWMPIPVPLQTMLRAYMATRPPSGPLLANRLHPGRHLRSDSVSRLIARGMQAIGLAETAHALRHTGATELMEATDGNVYVVKEALGHASLSSTGRYVARWRRRLAGYMDLLPDPLAPPAASATGTEGG